MKVRFPESVYLIGIGGSAMTPLAGMFAERGCRVTGSDTGVYPPTSNVLRELGIPWKEGFREENLAPPPELVVIGNAISRGNAELEYVLDQKIPYCSLPEALHDLFLPGHDSLVVTGTHGKTTTTSMLAWILHAAGRRPNFLIGGVAENFGKSYGLGGGAEFVLEGDEYDTAFYDKAPKFLHYRPDELIVTSLEFDHADIYADLAAIEIQFRRLVNLVPRRGRIVCWGESPTVRGVVSKAFCSVETYGLSADNDWIAGDIEFRDGATHFRVVRHGTEEARVELPMSGRHNVLNALAAIAVARSRGVSAEAIEQGFASFRGVTRRMTVRGTAGGVVVVDDFAHHPTAIRATIEAARSRWPGKPLWVAFEPRSNTMRRRIFESALADALATADGAVLGRVHRAQFLPEAERLSPERVVARMRQQGGGGEALQDSAQIAEFLAAKLRDGGVALILSNGSFDGLCEKLLATLSAHVSPV
jgi:UDP-N-acetylmuramate: L-alanyl-gamma-D-glutamyl-meso-diaminopimelate ligase